MKGKLQNRGKGLSKLNYTSEVSEELDDDENVWQVYGSVLKPFMIESLMCDNKFEAIINTGSPVSIFAVGELKKIIGEHRVLVRGLIDNEMYVDFSRRLFPMLGYIFVRLQMGKTRMSRAVC